MSLKPCRECGKEVSDQAKVCPHCGVQQPSASDSQRAAAAVVVLVFCAAFIGLIFWAVTSSLDSSDAASLKKEQECLSDLQCAGDKFQSTAGVYCKPMIEGQIKVLAKWDYKIDDAPFLQFGWADLDKKQILYLEGSARLQNGFGAWKRISYSCIFDIATKRPVSTELYQ